jgi:hypothetical protein
MRSQWWCGPFFVALLVVGCAGRVHSREQRHLREASVASPPTEPSASLLEVPTDARAVVHPAAASTCADLPAGTTQVFKEFYDYVMPGRPFLGPEQLTKDPLGRADWELMGQDSLDLGGVLVEVWHVGRHAMSAFVFVSPENSGRSVIAVYSADGPVYLHQAWHRKDCPMAVVILKSVLTTRSYYDEPGNEDSLVEGGDIARWIAIGLAPDRAWLAWEESGSEPKMQIRDGWPELRARAWDPACKGGASECYGERTFELRRDTLRFERTVK